MGTLLKGMSFFDEHAVTLDAKNDLVHMPDITMQARKKIKQQVFEKNY